jgi:hypothetical protein
MFPDRERKFSAPGHLDRSRKRLLVNSRNLCKAPSRATVKTVGQNGMAHDERPLMQNGSKAGAKAGWKKGVAKKGDRR